MKALFIFLSYLVINHAYKINSNNFNSRKKFISIIGTALCSLTNLPQITYAESIQLQDIQDSQKFNNEIKEMINESSYEESNNRFIVDRDNNKVYFYGDVTEESSILLQKNLIDAINESKFIALNYNIEPTPIELHIRSPGGSVLSIFGLIDYIKQSEIPIYSYIDGYSASAATLLSIVCKKRFISKHSFMLIHQLSSNTSGKFDDMNEELNNLNLFMNTIKELYLTNTKINESQIDDILKHDDWFSSSKCLELGLVDEII